MNIILRFYLWKVNTRALKNSLIHFLHIFSSKLHIFQLQIYRIFFSATDSTWAKNSEGISRNSSLFLEWIVITIIITSCYYGDQRIRRVRYARTRKLYLYQDTTKGRSFHQLSTVTHVDGLYELPAILVHVLHHILNQYVSTMKINVYHVRDF